MDAKYTNEIELKAKNGMVMLILSIILIFASIAAMILGAAIMELGEPPIIGSVISILGFLYLCICWIPFMGLKSSGNG